MTETWLPCREFPDYEVSSEGKIRNIYTGRILKTNINDKGYEIVCLRKDGKQYTRKPCFKTTLLKINKFSAFAKIIVRIH